MPSRRRVLRLGSAALVGLAGCSARQGEPTPTESPTATQPQTPTQTSTERNRAFGEAGPHGVDPTDATVQAAVRHLWSTDHNDIHSRDEWYVFVTVGADANGPAATEFRLRTPSDTYEPFALKRRRLQRRIEYENGRAYEPGASGWVLFAVPYDDDPERAWLTLDDTEWALPEPTVARLRATPPAFDLKAVEPPASPPHDEPFDVTIRVRNDGGAGTVRAAFNYTAPLYYPQGVAAAVDAGTTRELAVTVDIHVESEPGDTVAANVVSAGGDGEWSVTLS